MRERMKPPKTKDSLSYETFSVEPARKKSPENERQGANCGPGKPAHGLHEGKFRLLLLTKQPIFLSPQG